MSDDVKNFWLERSENIKKLGINSKIYLLDGSSNVEEII